MMPVRFVEQASLAFAANPAERVVVITARIGFRRLVLVAHLRVIDAGQDVDVVA